jgi:hypothetical protein
MLSSISSTSSTTRVKVPRLVSTPREPKRLSQRERQDNTEDAMVSRTAAAAGRCVTPGSPTRTQALVDRSDVQGGARSTATPATPNGFRFPPPLAHQPASPDPGTQAMDEHGGAFDIAVSSRTTRIRTNQSQTSRPHSTTTTPAWIATLTCRAPKKNPTASITQSGEIIWKEILHTH